MAQVIIYSTPSCVYCKMAKDYFRERKIEYREFDVASDVKAREEMLKKSHQMGVPVLDINGEIIVGFDRPVIDKALGFKH